MIVDYIPTPGQKVSAISCKYNYYGWIHIADFSHYLSFAFYAIIFTAKKKCKKHFLVIIFHTVCDR